MSKLCVVITLVQLSTRSKKNAAEKRLTFAVTNTRFCLLKPGIVRQALLRVAILYDFQTLKFYIQQARITFR
jgi:hypothetical protein